MEVPEEFKPYLPDYKMNLLEVHQWEKYPFQNENVKTLFGVLKRCYEKEWKKLGQEYPKISVEVADVIESVVQFEGLSEMREEQEGEIVMRQAMAELKQQYRTEGEEIGILKGRREGELLGRNQGILFSAKKMLENGISYKQIEKMLGVSRKDIEQYEEEQ